MNKNIILKLLEYNHNRNYIFLYEMNKHKNPFILRCIELMHHIINAQNIWINRLKGKEIILLDKELSLHNLIKINDNHFEELSNLLNNGNLNDMIVYKNLKCEDCQNTLEDILLHICNHGTHHRAQISTLMRQNKIEPIPSDYILFAREKTSKKV